MIKRTFYAQFVSRLKKIGNTLEIMKIINIIFKFSPVFTFRGILQLKEFNCYKLSFVYLLYIFLNYIMNFSNHNNGILINHFDEIKSYEFFQMGYQQNVFRIISFGCQNESINQGLSYDQHNINISDCSFSRMMGITGNGGVVHVYEGIYYMIISYSMFFNCSCSNDGGAIYFNSKNSSLKKICANKCIANSMHFAYLKSFIENTLEYASISACSYSTFGYYPVFLYWGNQCVDYSNCSLNNAQWTSGLLCSSSSSFSGSFNTFSNNNVSESVCIYLVSTIGILTFSNIIQNNSPFPQYSVVYISQGSPKMQYCVFDMNQNILFSVNGGSLEIAHSCISHIEASFLTSMSISIGNNNSIDTLYPLDRRLTYQHQFFQSYYCNAEIPFEIQTPINTCERTPSCSPIKTAERSIGETNPETPYRSFEICRCSCLIANRKEISIIFTLSFVLSIIILHLL